VQHTVQPSTVREETGDLQEPDTGEIPVVQKRDGRLTADPNDPDVAKAIHREHDKRERISRAKVVRARILIALGIVAMLIALAGAAVGGYLWSQTQYYLGVADGQMAIYQGVPTNLFGLELSHPVERTGLDVDDLPENWRTQLDRGIVFDDLDDARAHAEQIEQESRSLAQQSQDGTKPGDAKTGDTKTNDDTAGDDKALDAKSDDTRTSEQQDGGER